MTSLQQMIYGVRSITTDRTGGRTKSGFEYEDFIREGEGFTESESVSEGTAAGLKKARLLKIGESSHALERVADTLVGALITALDQVFSHESVSRRQVYAALSESLKVKLWQPEALPTGGLTFGVVTGRAVISPLTVQPFEEEASFPYRQESPEITKSFMQAARRFRPDAEKSGNLYSDQDLE